MVKSMTGFGRARTEAEGYRVLLEIKSLNHRFLDIQLRAPQLPALIEERVRAVIKNMLSRGRIEVSLSLEEIGEAAPQAVRLNVPLARTYLREVIELAREFGKEAVIDAGSLAGVPGLLLTEDRYFNEDTMWPVIKNLLEQALSDLVSMRKKEGERLTAVLTPRLCTLKDLIDDISGRACEVVVHYENRLRERISELKDGVPVDDTRLASEVAYFAERSDITEEIDRFGSHLEAFSEFLLADEPVGRKLEFTIQELYREANTLSAKAHDYEISRSVVEIKSELETIKEQVHNLE